MIIRKIRIVFPTGPLLIRTILAVMLCLGYRYITGPCVVWGLYFFKCKYPRASLEHHLPHLHVCSSFPVPQTLCVPSSTTHTQHKPSRGFGLSMPRWVNLYRALGPGFAQRKRALADAFLMKTVSLHGLCYLKAASAHGRS